MFRFDEEFRSEFRANWPYLLVGFLVLFFGFSAPAYALPFIYPEVIEEYGWNRQQATFLASVKYLTGAVACLVVGRLLDITGVWIALLCSIVVGGFALIGFFWIDSLKSYYFIGVLLGVAGPGAMVSVFVLVARSFKASQGTATGITLLGTGLGGVVMPLVTTWLIDLFGWRGGMVALSSGIWLIAVPLLLFGLFRLPIAEEVIAAKEAKTEQNNSGAIRYIRKITRQPNFWFLLVAFFIATAVDQAFTQHQVLIFDDTGLSTYATAMAISAMGLLSMPSRILAGNILDKNSNKGLAALYVVMSITAVLALMIGNMAVLFIFIAMRALAHAGSMIDGPVMARHCFGSQQLGILLGFFTAIANLGSSSGPWIAGLLFDQTGSYFTTFLLFIGLPLISAILIMQLKPYAWNKMKSDTGY